jgi:hypothetical protein
MDACPQGRKTVCGKAAQDAGRISDIIAGFDPHTGDGWKRMREALDRYAQLIEPWARSVELCGKLGDGVKQAA